MTDPEPTEESHARSVLGIGPKAGRSEVQRAFRALSKARHPDHGGPPGAFEELLGAYELLRSIDPEPIGSWITGDEDGSMRRIAWDSRPRPRRRTFRHVFADALREQRP